MAHPLVSMATTRPRPPLTIAEVMTMSEEDMRIECLRLQIPASGLDKSAIQRQLLGHIVARATSTPASQATAPLVYAAGKTDQLAPDLQGLDLEDLNLEESDHGQQDLEGQDQDLQETLYSPPRQGDSIRYPGGVQNAALPTTVLVSLGSGRIVPARQKPCHLPRVGPSHSSRTSLMPSCSSVA